MAFNYNNAFLLNGGPGVGGEVVGTGTISLGRGAGLAMGTGENKMLLGRSPHVIDLSQAIEASFIFMAAITGGVSVVMYDAGAAGTGTLGLWGETALGNSLGWTARSPRTGPFYSTAADLDADDWFGAEVNISIPNTATGAKGFTAMLAGVYGTPGAIA